MTSRKNVNTGLQESFEYDNMYRLTRVIKGNSITQQLTYDEAGNILSKSDVAGRYEYEDGSNKLTCLHKTKYTPVIWDDIRYNSFNKITFIRHGEDSLRLFYGADQSRCMSLKTVGGTTSRKMYFSSLYEEEQVIGSGVWTQTCYVRIGDRTVAILTTQGKANEMRYVHADPLGSAQAFSDTSGTLVQELSYDAWGRRRDPATWQYYEFIDDASAWNDRGFTGHEHIDIFELVNMDGRMYDPVLGRFLSPDPIVQAGDYTQSYNRYAYCLNNPLTLIDPTGYSWFSKNWKTIAAAAVGITVSVVTAGGGTGIGIGLTIAAGAAGGAAGALTGALLNGANFNHTMEATFRGAFWGAVSAAANYYIGDIENVWLHIGAHTLSEGALEGLQGGNMLHGFIMGALSCAGNSQINGIEGISKAGKIAMSAALGGTVEEIGGGKFANGAITTAYSMMFNEMMHGDEDGGGKKKGIVNTEIIEIGGVYYSNGSICGEKPLGTIWPEFDLLSIGRGVYTIFASTFSRTTVSINAFINEASNFRRLKGGVIQGVIRGDSETVFRKLANGCNAKIYRNGSERFFNVGKYRVGTHVSSRGGGNTIHINYNHGEKLYKIRLIP